MVCSYNQVNGNSWITARCYEQNLHIPGTRDEITLLIRSIKNKAHFHGAKIATLVIQISDDRNGYTNASNYNHFKIQSEIQFKNCVFWDIKPCNQLKVRHIRATYYLPHQGWRMSQARNQCEADSRQMYLVTVLAHSEACVTSLKLKLSTPRIDSWSMHTSGHL